MVAYEIHSTICVTQVGKSTDAFFNGPVVCEQDACWCALLQRLVREGGAITAELEERMNASGLDLDRLHRSLLSGRRKTPALDDIDHKREQAASVPRHQLLERAGASARPGRARAQRGGVRARVREGRGERGALRAIRTPGAGRLVIGENALPRRASGLRPPLARPVALTHGHEPTSAARDRATGCPSRSDRDRIALEATCSARQPRTITR